MDVKDLKVGDILLLKDDQYNYLRHTCIVSEVNPEQNIFKIIHWRGVGEQTGITEATLPPAEKMAELNRHFECFRLNDVAQIEKVMPILQQWLLYGIPYDRARYKKTESLANEFFGTHFDFENNVFHKVDPETFEPKLELHREAMEKKFIERYMDIVKSAARREISPVRPKKAGEKATGFHCLQGFLLAFQISYVMDFVKSVPDKWLSNKYTAENGVAGSSHPFFDSAKTALNENFNRDAFLAAIPHAFRLFAKECTIDTFWHAMVQDKKTISALGTVTLLKNADVRPDAETMKKDSLFLHQLGCTKREALMENVVVKSMRCL